MSENAESDIELDAATASTEAVKNVEKKKRALDKAKLNLDSGSNRLINTKLNVAKENLSAFGLELTSLRSGVKLLDLVCYRLAATL